MAVALVRIPKSSGILPFRSRARAVPLGIVRCEGDPCTSATDETDRIRSVFALSLAESLPRVNVPNLRTYLRHLADGLGFPFQALYAETKPPIRELVRRVSVLGLVEVIRSPCEGIVCTVDGLSSVWELPLAEIAVREDDPNCRLIDDYACWFLRSR